MRIGFIGASYTARSTAIADEECINFFAETLESQAAMAPGRAYGGAMAQAMRSYYGTPGLQVFCAFPGGPVRGVVNANGRVFAVAGAGLYEVAADGTRTARGAVANDGGPVSMTFSAIEVFLVAAGHAYSFTLATNTLLDVTVQMAGVPIDCEYIDGYFIVSFKDDNKFQISGILDGTTWPGLLVNEVSVFPEDITAIIGNHRELWVFGKQHAQPYQNTGSENVFDVIPGCLIETGCAATFAPCRVDNSVFWIDENERGSRSAWRSQGYTPTRISTHGVETDLDTYASIAGVVSYAYQDSGHQFWGLYIPGAPWTWVYDVGEGLWHKRAHWVSNAWQAHAAWNHVYAFDSHLVGDWNSGNLYEMSLDFLDDAGTTIRRLRRAPTVGEEMQWVPHAELVVDFDTGQGPQPPLTDGAGNPRPPQAMLRWSDDRGKTWSNEHVTGCGMAGEYRTRAVWRRLGRSRYRVYELSVSDSIPWTLVDAYLRIAGQP